MFCDLYLGLPCDRCMLLGFLEKIYADLLFQSRIIMKFWIILDVPLGFLYEGSARRKSYIYAGHGQTSYLEWVSNMWSQC
jgi:hypothetical protein